MFSLYGKLFSILKASFVYTGRTARKEFWFFFLFYVLMYFAALGADVSYFREATPTGWLASLQEFMGGREPFVWLYFFLFTPAMVAMTIRRLHDVGRTGWWTLAYLVPLLGLIPFVAMLSRKSQEGFNRFGTNPLMLSEVAQQTHTEGSADPRPAPSQMAAAE